MSNALIAAAIEFERAHASDQQWSAAIGAPQLIMNARTAFMAGAAAMALLCQESVTEELRQLRQIMSEFECKGDRCIYE